MGAAMSAISCDSGKSASAWVDEANPPAVDAGDTIVVDDVVENQGEANSGAFQVGIYLSTDTEVTTADILLGVRQIVDLAPSSGDSGVGTLTVPPETPPGIYYVGVVVDDVDDVFEQSEVNNGLVAGATLQINQPPLPDLVPTEISFTPDSVQAGDTIYVTEGVLNQGVSPASSFLVSVYLSADPFLDETDINLGYRGVSFLGTARRTRSLRSRSRSRRTRPRARTGSACGSTTPRWCTSRPKRTTS